MSLMDSGPLDDGVLQALKDIAQLHNKKHNYTNFKLTTYVRFKINVSCDN